MKLPDIKLLAMTAVFALLSACTVGPDYVRPSVETPAAFKEAGNWKPAQPQDDVHRGKWWEIYHDALLNDLMEQVNISNQTLAKAEAAYRQAVGLVESTRAGYYPTVTVGTSNTRSRASSNTIATPTTVPISTGVVVNHSLPVQASWAPDVWGNIRRAVEANEAGAQASAGDLAAARLSVQATLAQSYFQLRALDTQQQALEDTVADELLWNRGRDPANEPVRAANLDGSEIRQGRARCVDGGVHPPRRPDRPGRDRRRRLPEGPGQRQVQRRRFEALELGLSNSTSASPHDAFVGPRLRTGPVRVRKGKPVACTDGSFAPLAAGARPARGGAGRALGAVAARRSRSGSSAAREHGDIKENADYDAAKNEQGHNEAGSASSRRSCAPRSRSRALRRGRCSGHHRRGRRWTVTTTPSLYIVGSIEERSDEFEVLSTSSPLGQALFDTARRHRELRGAAPGRSPSRS